MTNAKISVVIPLYNKEPIISKTLHSVLHQDYVEYEIIVVDDGSTDMSYEIACKIKNEHEKGDLISIIQQKNAGPGAARNTGVKNARGEWIVFLDGDDELLENALSVFSEIIEKHDDIDIIDANKIILTGESKQLNYHPLEGYVKNPLRECFFGKIMPGNGSSAFRKEFMLRNLYNEQIRRFEDAELLIRHLPEARVFSIKTPTLLFNRNFASASHPRKDVMEDYFAYLDFKKRGFWRKMCVYKTFLEERELYPEYGKVHYSSMYWRYDMLLTFKFLNLISALFK